MSERYARQMMLPEVGAAGQARLERASVLVVGAGGLGCAASQYLAAAGIGCLTVMDHDRVEQSNLARQPLYRMSDLGAPKAEAARLALLAANPSVQVHALRERLTPANASRCLQAVDIVLDAADSFAVTYILSDACLRVSKYLISASVLGYSGYVGAFCGEAPSYRAVFPQLPPRAGSCAQNGVLGTAVGVLGTLQAHLTLALLLGLDPSVAGRMISVDLRTLQFGGFSFRGAAEPSGTWLTFIDASDLTARDVVVDLRGEEEAPTAVCREALRHTADALEQSAGNLPRERRIVLCCRSGLRAWRAATALQRQGYANLALIALGP